MAKPLSLYEVPIFHALKENSDLQHQPILQIKIIIIMKFNISKILFYDWISSVNIMGWLLKYPYIMHLMDLTLADVLGAYTADVELKCTPMLKPTKYRI